MTRGEGSMKKIFLLVMFFSSMASANIEISVKQPDGELKYFDKNGGKIKVGSYSCDGTYKFEDKIETYSISCNIKGQVAFVTTQGCGPWDSPGHKGYNDHDVAFSMVEKPHSKSAKIYDVKLHCKAE